MQKLIDRMLWIPLLCLLTLSGCDDLELPFPVETDSSTTETTTTEDPAPSEPAPAPESRPAPAPQKPTAESVLAAITSKSSMQVTDQDLQKFGEVDGSLDSVTSLDLKGAKLTEAGLKAIAALPALTRLDLNTARIQDADWQGLAEASSLEWLNLQESSINSVSLAALSGLTSLKSLNLSGTRVTDDAFQHLSEMSSLEELRINGLRIEGTGMEALGRKGANAPLKLIHAGGTSFGMMGFVHVKDFNDLEELYVGGSSVTDDSLSALKRITTLRRISLGNNPLVSDLGLQSLSKSRGLTYIDLTGVRRISDHTLRAFSKFDDLKELRINDSACTVDGVKKFKEVLPDCRVMAHNKEY